NRAHRSVSVNRSLRSMGVTVFRHGPDMCLSINPVEVSSTTPDRTRLGLTRFAGRHGNCIHARSIMAKKQPDPIAEVIAQAMNEQGFLFQFRMAGRVVEAEPDGSY